MEELLEIVLHEYEMQHESWRKVIIIYARESFARPIIEKNKLTKFNKFYRFTCATGEVIYTVNPFLFDEK